MVSACKPDAVASALLALLAALPALGAGAAADDEADMIASSIAGKGNSGNESKAYDVGLTTMKLMITVDDLIV